MTWNQVYPKGDPPNLSEISDYIQTPLWDALCTHLESIYAVTPTVEHSRCSGAPGWNLKYKKGGRALCTLYPAQGFFTCMVSVGSKEVMEAELLLGGCTEYVQTLYQATKPFNGGRWLMIGITSAEILEDVKMLISLRMNSTKRNNKSL